MKYFYSCQTDKGTVRSNNQDSLVVKGIKCGNYTALLAAVCDGVGGMSYGELTSRRAAEMLAAWVDYELPQILEQGADHEIIRYRFRQMILDINAEIYFSNQRNHVSSGTTLTVLLLWNYCYLIGHVGDSRIYTIDQSVDQLTTDHSWIAQEISAGRMTKEEAKYDQRQNLILKCIGAEKELSPQIREGEVSESTVFILCTDGFWHNMKDSEWLSYLSPQQADTDNVLGENLRYLIQEMKSRGETDNITAVAIRVF